MAKISHAAQDAIVTYLELLDREFICIGCMRKRSTKDCPVDGEILDKNCLQRDLVSKMQKDLEAAFEKFEDAWAVESE